MSNTRYIEVNSTYRDRNLWPLAAEFEIPISQTGTKSISNAIDPVSLSMPIFSWTGNNLDLNNSYIIGTLPTGPGSTSTLKIDNLEKPIRTITSYSIAELVNICNKLDISIINESNKKKTKAELYSNILQKL